MGSQVDHFEPGAAKEVGEHRARQRVPLSGGSRHDHTAALTTAAGEAWTEATDEAFRDDRRTVLVGHAQTAGGPVGADDARTGLEDLRILQLGMNSLK